MRRTFIAFVVAVLAIDVAFIQRWERAIAARAQERERAVSAREQDAERREEVLKERESVLDGMFGALADARAALLRTIQNLEDADYDASVIENEEGEQG